MNDKASGSNQVLALRLMPEARPQPGEVLPAKPSSPSSSTSPRTWGLALGCCLWGHAIATQLFLEGTMAVMSPHRPGGTKVSIVLSVMDDMAGWGQAAPGLSKPLLKSPKIKPPPQSHRGAGKQGEGLLSSFKGGCLHEHPAAHMRGRCVCICGHVMVPQSFPAVPLLDLLATTPRCSPGAPPPHDRCPGQGFLLGEPKLRALGVLRLRPLTLVVKGTSSSRRRGSSWLGEAIRQT